VNGCRRRGALQFAAAILARPRRQQLPRLYTRCWSMRSGSRRSAARGGGGQRSSRLSVTSRTTTAETQLLCRRFEERRPRCQPAALGSRLRTPYSSGRPRTRNRALVGFNLGKHASQREAGPSKSAERHEDRFARSGTRGCRQRTCAHPSATVTAIPRFRVPDKAGRSRG